MPFLVYNIIKRRGATHVPHLLRHCWYMIVSKCIEYIDVTKGEARGFRVRVWGKVWAL